MVKASKDSEAGMMPCQELLTAMGKYNEELVKAGVMLAGEGLHPTSKGKRVRFAGSSRTVIDGPFAETKEALGGYFREYTFAKRQVVDWTTCGHEHHEPGVVLDPFMGTGTTLEVAESMNRSAVGVDLKPMRL